jgi:hypothetical protein
MDRISVYLAKPEGIPASGLPGAIMSVPAEVAGFSDVLAAVKLSGVRSGPDSGDIWRDCGCFRQADERLQRFGQERGTKG